MKLNVRINQLVLDGLSITDADVPRLHESLVQCLAQRFASEPIDRAAVPNLAAELTIGTRLDPVELGRDVAHSLYPSPGFRSE